MRRDERQLCAAMAVQARSGHRAATRWGESGSRATVVEAWVASRRRRCGEGSSDAQHSATAWEQGDGLGVAGAW